jgi:hypothetical protein
MNIHYIYQFFINKDYNKLIDIIYEMYDDIKSIISNKNIQVNKKIDLVSTLSYYNHNNNLTEEEQNFIPVILKKIIYLIVKKQKILINYGKDEFAKRTKTNVTIRNDDKYFTCVIKDISLKKLFILQSLFFGFEAIHQHKKHNTYFVGLDFEFNNNKIALAQICFFPRNKGKYIWILDPNELDKIQLNRFIDNLLINDSLYKILHGADSLDIPYMFHQIFNSNKENIFKFIRRLIDTRFLCEFFKLVVDEKDNKCSIYNALLYFGTIDQTIFNRLEHLNKDMGPIYKIKWNVHTLTSVSIKYALFDVLFLREFLFDILRQSKEKNIKNPKNVAIVPELTRLVYLEKWGFINIIAIIKPFLDNLNFNNKFNNYLQSNNYLEELELDINDLLNINYLKSILLNILKYLYYCKIEKIDNAFIFNILDNLKLKKLRNVFENFIKSI